METLPACVQPFVCSHNNSCISFHQEERRPLKFEFKLNNAFLHFKIILHSMHKYQPRIHIIKKKDTSDTVAVDVEKPSSLRKTFVFPDTVFTTVTAYQNQQVQYIKHCSQHPLVCIKLIQFTECGFRALRQSMISVFKLESSLIPADGFGSGYT